MDAETRASIERIHASPWLVVYEFAGAGATALAWLHLVAGSSRTVLEATDRYSGASLAALLGAPPKQAVAEDTAAAMARAALARARALAPHSPDVLGLACTATIATDRAKRGDHRGFVACAGPRAVTVEAVVLDKGRLDREGEEEAISRRVLALLARCVHNGAP